jgi:signal peptidase I
LSESAAARRHPAREYLEVLLVALVVALYARTFLLQAFRVPSDSMAPNLRAGDHLLVNKFLFGGGAPWLPTREVRRHDLVVFRLPEAPEEVLVKRCVALGGERVELRDKVLFVEDQPVAEPWVVHRDQHVYPSSAFTPPELRSRDNYGPVRVPTGHLFCLGDNRDESRDSRSFGTVPEERVLGQPLLVYWSSTPGEAIPAGGGALARSRLGALVRKAWAVLRPPGGAGPLRWAS